MISGAEWQTLTAANKGGRVPRAVNALPVAIRIIGIGASSPPDGSVRLADRTGIKIDKVMASVRLESGRVRSQT